MPNALEKFTKNKPLFYGTLGLAGIGAVWYYRHKQASSAGSAAPADTSGTGQQTDPAGNVGIIDPQTGYVYGSPEDTAMLQQSGGFAGNPFGGGTFGSSGGGPTGGTVNDITTKEAWVQAAEQILPNGGSATVRDALLGVLGGLTVTSAQRNIFLEAVGVLGDPPGGYPRPIKVSDTPGQPHGGRVVVPNVKGMTFDKAQLTLRHAGLDAHKAKPAIHIVESESPVAGSHVTRGTTITLDGKA